MQMRLVSVALLAFAASATAQTLVVPSVAAAVDGNSSSGWPFDLAAGRFLYVYDSAHFTGNGVNFPILITGIRWRANAVTATWTGSSAAMTLDLSTTPVDYTAISTTWNSNHGVDRAQVFNGTMTIPAGSSTTGTPGPFHCGVTFASPFLYDPTLGDLTIDTVHSGITTANTPTMDAVTTAGATLAKRVYSTTNPPAATATLWSGDIANVLEFTYTPASGLYAGFTANVTSGASPLAVNFTDTSFTSDIGGITSWSWDFDGDSNIDSTAQNPSFVYTGCGTYNVSLTVTDATHSPSTFTRTAYISTDNITANFTYALLAAPNFYQFTDTSTPPATAWDWDFNGDNITDSTAQNPVWPMNQCAYSNVRLIATRNCKSGTKTQSVFISPAMLTTTYVSTNGGASGYGVFFDLNVTNPAGINICAMDHNMSSTVGTAFTVNVYATPGTYVGADTTGSLWRLVGTGAGNSAGTGVACTTPMASPFYLPMGTYGMAVYYTGASMRYEGTNAVPPVQNTFSNADLTLTGGIVHTTLWGGTLFTPRLWNGAIHYDTAALGGSAGFGFFGAGCAGSLGVSNQTASGRPQLGSNLNVTLNNLPQSLAIMMTGFSNTTSPFGPLPLDLTVFGAPGCSARVSPDVTTFLIGAGNSATWNFAVPNAFAGIVLYNQALVLDTGFNALGGVMSDASAMQFGL